MLDDINASAERAANGEAMSAGCGLSDIREERNYHGRRVLTATSRPVRSSLFSNVNNQIRSDAIESDTSCLTSRVRAMIWCIRTLELEAERDCEKLDKMSYVMDTFLNALGHWMDDIDEVGSLAWKNRAAGGE